MVNLKAKPFNLDDEAIKWVDDTIAGMSLDEKLGQLFIDLTGGTDEEEIRTEISRAKMGGMRYVNLPAEDIWEQNHLFQKNSKIPLIIAANLEAGGNGCCKGGTEVGAEVKIAATNDAHYAYELGQIGGIEGRAVGCNMSFTPIVDLIRNWRNPIISTRAFSEDTDKVIEMSRACLKGLKSAGMGATAKHFPGDGIDERDHHFSSSVNSLSVEEWDASFGRIYKALIDDGVNAIMAGHIMQPAYQKYYNPDMKQEDLLPASLCKELLTDLLRGKLGFNGVIVTDASHMVGMTGSMARCDLVPTAIAAGCDLFLFFNDIEEDLAYMKAGYEKGIITHERLSDALRRILGLKASLNLHKGGDYVFPPKEGLKVVGCEGHKKVAKEVSDRAITLAKQVGKSPLPLTPEKYKRIMLMPVQTPSTSFSKFVGIENGAERITEIVKEKLEALGFEVTIFTSPLEKKGNGKLNAYNYKSSVEEFKKKYDAVITLANVGSFQITQRLNWMTPKGGYEVPWYVFDMPVIFVSFACPFHLADVPQVKTYINCYDAQDDTVDSLVEKLTGTSQFTGISPVDVFCGLPDTKI